MKVTLKAYLFQSSYAWDKKPQYQLYSFKFDDTEDHSFVKEVDVEVEVPDGFDPTAQRIAALEAKKAKARDDFTRAVMELDRKISELQAIEYTGEAV